MAPCDIVDDSLVVPYTDAVPRLYQADNYYLDSPDQVRQGALETERYGDTAYPERGDYRAYIHIETAG